MRRSLRWDEPRRWDELHTNTPVDVIGLIVVVTSLSKRDKKDKKFKGQS